MSREQWVVLGLMVFAAVAILIAVSVAIQRNADTEAARVNAEDRIHRIETNVAATHEAERGD